MCSACITIAPSASNSAVDASRRSLMLAECAERTSTAPISSQAARRAPSITWSVTGSMRLTRALQHHGVGAGRRRASRAAPPASSRRSSNTAGPVQPRLAGAEHARLALVAGEPRARAALAAVAAALGRGSGPGTAAVTRTVTSSSSASCVAVAVAALVGAVERAAAARRRPGVRRRLHRQLEGLARVAQLVGRAQLRVRARPARRGRARPSRSTRRREALLRQLRRRPAARSRPRRGGARRARARARRARRRCAGTITRRIPSSSAISAAWSGPGAAEGHEREVARVDPALDGDHAHGRGHLGVGHPHDPERGVHRIEVRARRPAPPRPAPRRRGRARRRRPAASRRRGGPSSRLASVTVGSSPPRP